MLPKRPPPAGAAVLAGVPPAADVVGVDVPPSVALLAPLPPKRPPPEPPRAPLAGVVLDPAAPAPNRGLLPVLAPRFSAPNKFPPVLVPEVAVPDGGFVFEAVPKEKLPAGVVDAFWPPVDGGPPPKVKDIVAYLMRGICS